MDLSKVLNPHIPDWQCRILDELEAAARTGRPVRLAILPGRRTGMRALHRELERRLAEGKR